MSVLETERLRLRELVTSDGPFVLELLNEPAWLRFVGDKGLRTVADAERYVETVSRPMYARHGFGAWLVERKADGVAVGICGLMKRDVLDTVDLGYGFLARHRGQGYAHESASAALAHGRREFSLERVIALTACDNDSSMKVLRRLGFRFDHVRPRCAVFAESNVFVWEPEF